MNDSQVFAAIHTVEGKVDSFRREVESINDNINFFKTQINELYKKPDVPAEFEEFKRITGVFVNDLCDKNISTKSLLLALKNEIDLIKSCLNIQSQKINSTCEVIPILEERISEAKDELSKKIVSISTAFTSRFDDHAEKQKKQLEIFSDKAFSAPNSVIESNRTIIERLETASLDGANAMLKVNNLDLTVRMLERKLENLALQVKKNELSQQS